MSTNQPTKATTAGDLINQQLNRNILGILLDACKKPLLLVSAYSDNYLLPTLVDNERLKAQNLDEL